MFNYDSLEIVLACTELVLHSQTSEVPKKLKMKRRRRAIYD